MHDTFSVAFIWTKQCKASFQELTQLLVAELHENAAHCISSTLPVMQSAPARTEKYSRPKLELKNGMVAEEDW